VGVGIIQGGRRGGIGPAVRPGLAQHRGGARGPCPAQVQRRLASWSRSSALCVHHRLCVAQIGADGRGKAGKRAGVPPSAAARDTSCGRATRQLSPQAPAHPGAPTLPLAKTIGTMIEPWQNLLVVPEEGWSRKAYLVAGRATREPGAQPSRIRSSATTCSPASSRRAPCATCSPSSRQGDRRCESPRCSPGRGRAPSTAMRSRARRRLRLISPPHPLVSLRVSPSSHGNVTPRRHTLSMGWSGGLGYGTG